METINTEKNRAYIVFDLSHTITRKTIDRYEEIVKYYSAKYKCVFISHAIEAQEIWSRKDLRTKSYTRSYASAGLSLALAKAIINGNEDKATIVYASDGAVWGGDHDKVDSIVHTIQSLGIRFVYHEINPDDYTLTLYEHFENKQNKVRNTIEQYCVNNDTTLFGSIREPQNEYVVYKVEHAVGGKQYKFISDDLLKIDDMVICDTSQGQSYGKIVDIKYIWDTEKGFNQRGYKTIKKLEL